MPTPSPNAAGQTRLVIDRVACTGKGVCARIQPDAITLDEWGYPLIDASRVDPALIDRTVKMCPARALYLTRLPARARQAQPAARR
jgi:ferredoxin